MKQKSDCIYHFPLDSAPLKPLRVNSALRALSSLRSLRGAPVLPPLCRETSVSRTANVGTWLRKRNVGQKWVKGWLGRGHELGSSGVNHTGAAESGGAWAVDPLAHTFVYLDF